MSTEGAKQYFEKHADDFNSYYRDSKIPLLNSIKRYLWRDLLERERLTVKLSRPISGKKILDIGCGDGHYGRHFLAEKCHSYMGLDFSEEMIRQASQQFSDSDQVRFVCGNFMKLNFEDRFDIIVAMGVLDYVKEPGAFLEKILDLTRDRVLVSFPQRTKVRGAIRYLKYGLRGCAIYLYTMNEITSLLNQISAVRSYRIHSISGVGMDYVVEVFPRLQSGVN